MSPTLFNRITQHQQQLQQLQQLQQQKQQKQQKMQQTQQLRVKHVQHFSEEETHIRLQTRICENQCRRTLKVNWSALTRTEFV